MPYMINPETGERELVPNDQTQTLAESGEMEYDPSEKYTVINSEGDPVQFSGKNASKMLVNRGSSLQSESDVVVGIQESANSDAYGGVLGGAQTVVEGALSGATLGGTDLIFDALDPGGLQGRRNEFPTLSTASTVAGAVVPGVLSGGTGAAGSLARLTPAGRLTSAAGKLSGRLGGGIKGMAVAGAAEGAAFNAGQTASRLAIQDEPLTAEAVFGEMGMGIAMGGGLGLAGGVLGGALGKVGTKLDEAVLPGTNPVLDLASKEGQALSKGLNRTASEIDDVSKAIYAKGNEMLAPAGDNIFDGVVARNMDEFYDSKMVQVSEHIDNVNAGVYSKYDDVAEAVTKKPSAVASKADDVGDATIAGARGKRKAVDIAPAAPAKKTVDKFTQTADEMTAGAREARKKFSDFLETKGLVAEGRVKWDQLSSLKGKDLSKAEDLFTGMQNASAKMLDDALMPEQALIAREMAKSSPVRAAGGGASPEARAAIDASRTAETGFRKAIGASVDEPIDFTKIIGQSQDDAISSVKAFDDYAKKLKETADLVDGPGGAASARIDVANKEISELIAQSVGKDGKLPELAELLVIFGLEEAVLPDIGGPAGDLLKLYLAHKMVKGMHGAGRVSTASSGARSALKHGVANAAGRIAARGDYGLVGAAKFGGARHAANRIMDSVVGGSGKLASAAEKSAQRVKNGMAAALKSSGRAAKRSSPVTTTVLNEVWFSGDEKPKKEKTAQAAFKARSSELSRNIANLPAFQQRVHDNLVSVRQANVGVGDKLAAHTVATAQFLHGKMPKDPGTLQQFGISKWRPTEAELDKWARYINAAKDPAGVVERFGNGHMSREDAETLRTLHPAHFAKVQEWVMDNLENMMKNMSYERRIQTSSLIGVPADPTVSRVDVWQESFAQEPQQQPLKQMNNESTSKPTAAQQMSGTRE